MRSKRKSDNNILSRRMSRSRMMGRTLTHPTAAASFYGEAILLCFALLSVNIAEASWGSSERED